MCQSAMTWMIGIGIVLCAWGILSVVGAERTRMIRKMHRDWQIEQAQLARRSGEAPR